MEKVKKVIFQLMYMTSVQTANRTSGANSCNFDIKI